MSAKQQFTIVYYYVPEDLDEFTQLNAFVVRKKIDDIRLPDIISEFPMQGSYHFRFRCNVQKNRAVWLDLNNTTCKLPLSDDKIIMKVTRISWTESTPQVAPQLSKILDQQEKQAPSAKSAPQPANPNLIGFETIVDKPVEIAKPRQPPSQNEQPQQNEQPSGTSMFAAMSGQSSGSASPERVRMSGGATNLLNLEHSPVQKPQAGNNLLLEGLENLKF